MKILFVHNSYQQKGGEDTVVAAEAELLSDYGHEVQLWSVDNKDLPTGVLGKIKTAISASYSYTSKMSALKILNSFQPDIVHVHNFFPQVSPSIYDACLETKIPVIQTLHNYRLICPGALLMRDGKTCELCITGTPYHSVLYGCYRNSKAGSLVVAHMVALHRNKRTWNNKVSRFIALTEFAKSKFVNAGFPAEGITVKPNFTKQQLSKTLNKRSFSQPPFALYVGRLSQEKGIDTLVKAWQNIDKGIKLKVAGDGDFLPLLKNQNNIEVLGFLKPDDIQELMQQALFLIMPSKWYEGFPMVLVEAFSNGLPVIASNLGSLAEIVTDGITGLLFETGNPEDLTTKINWLVNNQDACYRMRENAKIDFQTNYTPEKNVRQLLDIYESAIQEIKL